MILEDLKRLCESGQFHHATYRNIGQCWEGLYIYKRDVVGFRGFTLFGKFTGYHPDPKQKVELRAAEDFLRSVRHGVSVGSYGQG